jgi:hypothetical protein
MCFNSDHGRHASFAGFDFVPIPHQKKGESLKVVVKPRNSKKNDFTDVCAIDGCPVLTRTPILSSSVKLCLGAIKQGRHAVKFVPFKDRRPTFKDYLRCANRRY